MLALLRRLILRLHVCVTINNVGLDNDTVLNIGLLPGQLSVPVAILSVTSPTRSLGGVNTTETCHLNAVGNSVVLLGGQRTVRHTVCLRAGLALEDVRRKHVCPSSLNLFVCLWAGFRT